MTTLRVRTIVEDWHYDDGWHEIPHSLRKFYTGAGFEFQKESVGWHCLVYPGSDIYTGSILDKVNNNLPFNPRDAFIGWMEENMKGCYEADYRFNSGDPMYTVYIRDEEDAVIFRLKWL